MPIVGPDLSDLLATVADLDVRAIVLNAAARSFDNPEGDQAEATGNYSVTHGDVDVTLTQAEMKALSNYGKAARS